MSILDELKQKTNKELLEYCERNEIKINAKNKYKPSKAELLQSIKEFMNNDTDSLEIDTLEDEIDKLDEEIANYQEPEEDNEEEEFVEEKKDEKLSAIERIKEEKALVRCIIRLNPELGETPKPNQVYEVSWGNELMGATHEIFPLNKPWHLTRGSIKALSTVTFRKPIVDPTSGEISSYEIIKKWFIDELPPLTKEELKDLSKKQLIRNNSNS